MCDIKLLRKQDFSIIKKNKISMNWFFFNSISSKGAQLLTRDSDCECDNQYNVLIRIWVLAPIDYILSAIWSSFMIIILLERDASIKVLN